MTPPRAGNRPRQVASSDEPRRLTDARSMRALAHPARIALLEVLVREGPLTATEASELVGESPSNCSFHLRTLAKYGFVEEAEGGAGRARPWRLISLGSAVDPVRDDPDESMAASMLADVHIELIFDRLRAYAARRGDFPRAWREVAFTDNTLTYLTPEEMAAIEEELLGVLQRYRARTLDLDQRPEGSAPVTLAVIGHPLPPLPSGN